MSFNEMKTYTLSELCEIKYGKDHKKLLNGSVPVYGTGGIMRYTDSHLYDKESVLIPRKGTLSNIFFVKGKFWTVDTLFWTKINEEVIIPKFLYYKLLTIDFSEMNVGSAVPSLTTELLNRVQLDIPSLDKQKAIANILSSLDDKIELNNKINKNLEKLAQTLYKRWFVDFEFPNENGEPYKTSGGEMVESELGLIPKGWKIKSIFDIVETILGGTPSRSNSSFWGHGHEWLKSGELNNLRIIKGTESITDLGLQSSATKLMPVGTTLIAITGYVGIISMLEIEACANQSVVGVVPNNKYPRSYIYSMIKDEIETIASKQTGSAQQHINKNDINTHKIVCPPELKITYFSSIVEDMHRKIAINLFENQKLTKIRNELLPKLMNGEIEVPIGE